MSVPTTLKQMCPSDGFKATLEIALRTLAQQSRQATELNSSMVDHFIGRHIGALEELADHVGAMALSDPLLWGLWLLRTYGGGDGDRWGSTGEKQGMLLNQLGRGAHTPDPRSTVAELLAAGVQDFVNSQVERNRRLSRFEAENAELVANLEDIERLERELTEANEREVAVRGELAESEEKRRTLMQLLESGGPDPETPAPAMESPKPSKLPRRQKAGDHPGVYSRVNSEGETVYEIGWTDEGKQRWKVVGPDIEEAIAERIRVTTPQEAAA